MATIVGAMEDSEEKEEEHELTPALPVATLCVVVGPTVSVPLGGNKRGEVLP